VESSALSVDAMPSVERAGPNAPGRPELDDEID
jgi:hypothetical protein